MALRLFVFVRSCFLLAVANLLDELLIASVPSCLAPR